jgi:hypothetical protein
MVQGRVTFACCPPAGTGSRLPNQKCACQSQWKAAGGTYTRPIDCGRIGSCSRGRCPPTAFPGTLSASSVQIPGRHCIERTDEASVAKVTLVAVDPPALSSAQASCSEPNDQHLITSTLNAAMRCVNGQKHCSRPCLKESSCSPQRHCSRRGYSYTLGELLYKRGQTYSQQSLYSRKCCEKECLSGQNCCDFCAVKDANVVRRNNTPFQTVAGVDSSLYIEAAKLNAQLQLASGRPVKKEKWSPLKLPTRINNLGLQRVAPLRATQGPSFLQPRCQQ